MNSFQKAFDIPISGFDESSVSIIQLMKTFIRAANSDPEAALQIGKIIEESGYISGRIAYAHFLWTAAGITIPAKERYQEAERILLEISNHLDISHQIEMELAVELAGVYGVTGRSVGYWAALLRARRYGASLAACDVERARKMVMATDINQLGDYPEDAYALAVELDAIGADRLTEFFYQLATESNRTAIKGKAALQLAEFYDQHKCLHRNYYDEANKYYAMAEYCGFPAVLSR